MVSFQSPTSQQADERSSEARSRLPTAATPQDAARGANLAANGSSKPSEHNHIIRLLQATSGRNSPNPSPSKGTARSTLVTAADLMGAARGDTDSPADEDSVLLDQAQRLTLRLEELKAELAALTTTHEQTQERIKALQAESSREEEKIDTLKIAREDSEKARAELLKKLRLV